MKHRAENTIDVLMRAFLRRDLHHGGLCSCAVGSLVNNGLQYFTAAWFFEVEAERYSYKSELKRISYTLRELATIEAAFEGRRRTIIEYRERIEDYGEGALNARTDSDSFLGLCSVFDTLCNNVDRDYFASRAAFKLTSDCVTVLEDADVLV